MLRLKPLAAIFLISVFLFTCFAGENPELPEKSINSDHSFSVLSFNVRYNNKGDGINAWPNRKEKVAALIRFHGVELAGLQEVLSDQLEDLKMLLPGFGWFGVGRKDGKNEGEFAPVFYLKARFDLLKSGTFWLSETPDKPSKGWDAALNRIVTWVKLKDKKTQKEFYFFNTHFDHRGEKARAQSALLVLQKIKEIAGDHPVIVTGDFNTEITGPPYLALTDPANPLQLSDACSITLLPFYGPDSTFGGGFDEACKEGKKIDFIFVKNKVQVLRHGVLTDSWNGICPSDHMPLLAIIYL